MPQTFWCTPFNWRHRLTYLKQKDGPLVEGLLEQNMGSLNAYCGLKSIKLNDLMVVMIRDFINQQKPIKCIQTLLFWKVVYTVVKYLFYRRIQACIQPYTAKFAKNGQFCKRTKSPQKHRQNAGERDAFGSALQQRW